jgi:hypothetical protein
LEGIEPATKEDRDLAHAATLVRWLDERYLDPLIGLLLPELGDLLTAVAGSTSCWSPSAARPGRW